MTQPDELKKAQELGQHHEWTLAAQACEAIIRTQPSHIEAAYLLAVAYLNLGKLTPS
ncbi:MAG: hypothetical protein ACYC3N_01840 [Halothiobacillus sp.]